MSKSPSDYTSHEHNPCYPKGYPDDPHNDPTVPNPCSCGTPPSPVPHPPRHPRRPRRPSDDCCQQLIDILQQIPGLELPKPHKPKQKPARKAQRLCETLGISDAIVPLLAVLWKRFEDGTPGRNDFEKG